MEPIQSKPQLISATPALSNNGEFFTVSLPITNFGQETAERIYVTSISLGSAPRQSPQSFPVHIGDLRYEALGHIGARFHALGLAAGSRHLLTVRGTFGRTQPIGFSFSRYLTVPAAAPDTTVILRSRASVALATATWNYTLHNDEPAGSALEIVAFHLDVVAPLELVSSPPGWVVETDSLSYVAWFAGDARVPRVRPGASLAGFSLQSATARSEATAFSLTSWDSQQNSVGPVGLDSVLSPMRP